MCASPDGPCDGFPELTSGSRAGRAFYPAFLFLGVVLFARCRIGAIMEKASMTSETWRCQPCQERVSLWSSPSSFLAHRRRQMGGDLNPRSERACPCRCRILLSPELAAEIRAQGLMMNGRLQSVARPGTHFRPGPAADRDRRSRHQNRRACELHRRRETF